MKVKKKRNEICKSLQIIELTLNLNKIIKLFIYQIINYSVYYLILIKYNLILL